MAGVSQAAIANVVVGELMDRPKANAADVMDMVVANTSSCYQPKEAR